MKLSTSFHPQTLGKIERTIKTIKGIFSACVIDFKGSCHDHLPLVDISYNNSSHLTVFMAPFEALHGRRCRSSVG